MVNRTRHIHHYYMTCGSRKALKFWSCSAIIRRRRRKEKWGSIKKVATERLVEEVSHDLGLSLEVGVLRMMMMLESGNQDMNAE